MTAGTHGSTFGGNPLAMAVGNAAIDLATADGFLDNVRRNSLLLKQRLAELKDRHASVIAEVRGEGLLIGLRLVPPVGAMVDELRAEKMLTVAAGDNVVRLLPPLIIGEAEISEAVSRIDRACTRLAQMHARPQGGRVMSGNGVRHFLDLIDIPKPTLAGMITHSREMKAARARGIVEKPLAEKTMAMIFDKPSTRTRVSFDVAMRQLGGEAIMLTAQEMQFGRGETLADTARVLSRFVDAIMIRILDDDAVAELARHATVPVINGLTRRSHPCQVLADVMTFEEKRGLDPRPHRGLDRRFQQCAGLLDARRRALRFPVARGLPERAQAEEMADGLGEVFGRRHPDRRRSGGRGQGRRLRGHRHLGVDGRPRRQAPPQHPQALSGQRPADEQGQAGRRVHALPAGASRRGGHRRGDRRAAVGGVRRGGEPAARPEGPARLVPARGRA